MSIKDWLDKASFMIIAVAVVGTYLGVTAIMIVTMPDHEITQGLATKLEEVVTIAVTAIFVKKATEASR